VRPPGQRRGPSGQRGGAPLVSVHGSDAAVQQRRVVTGHATADANIEALAFVCSGKALVERGTGESSFGAVNFVPQKDPSCCPRGEVLFAVRHW